MLAPAMAAEPASDDTTAFRAADATSFYAFDGCGDPLTGRMYRDVLAEKLAHCPFTPEAGARYRAWSRGQREKATTALQRMVDEHGGLPVRLEGMDRTCHEQAASPEYRQLRSRLEQHARGEISAEAALPGSCDDPAGAP